MDLDKLNELPVSDAEAELLKYCGSKRWAQAMAAARPFADAAELFDNAERAFSILTEEDWLEAFRAHPKIGEKHAAKPQSEQEKRWSAQEQSSMQAAATDKMAEFAKRNREYEARFGFIFIVCASGKSSEEMLAILNRRMMNDRQTELRVAAAEQQKISRLRLEKLLNS